MFAGAGRSVEVELPEGSRSDRDQLDYFGPAGHPDLGIRLQQFNVDGFCHRPLLAYWQSFPTDRSPLEGGAMSYPEELLCAYRAGLADPRGICLDEARKAVAGARNARDRGRALADLAWALSRLLNSGISAQG